MISNLLTIAGSDPSGGAGIQADLKTFSALGCYGMSVITALTAQNTKGVRAIHEVPAHFLRNQLEAVFEDIDVHAVKIGMLGAPEIVDEIAKAVKRFKLAHVVLDPVMVAQSGDALINDETINALKKQLIPHVSIITPNIPEAEILAGEAFEGDLSKLGQAVFQAFNIPVLLKGGHDRQDLAKDILVNQSGLEAFTAPWIETKNNHGTGCTLSSALACYLAQGQDMKAAVKKAKAYITGALEASHDLKVGHGAGPVNHFHDLWDKR